MTRQDVIELIIKKMLMEYRYQKKAAESIGITSVHLSRILNDDSRPIPDKLLSWVGVEKIETITYKRVK